MEDLHVKIIKVKASALADNDADANRLRQENRKAGTYYLNLMSSPGSGKTSVLVQTIKCLKDKMSIGVMEADIDSDVDAQTIAEAGVKSIQIHTGGMCHLDADMSRQGLREIDADHLDLVILENVGNLVCPAEFDTGAVKNAVILSIPEGDDKPLKYPLMFQKADVLLVNKIDALEAFDFSFEKLEKALDACHPGLPVFPLSAETGEGIDSWCNWLENEVKKYQQEI